MLLINNKDEKIEIILGYAKFLKPGIELIEILDVPMDDRLMSVMDAVLETDVIYKPLTNSSRCAGSSRRCPGGA